VVGGLGKDTEEMKTKCIVIFVGGMVVSLTAAAFFQWMKVPGQMMQIPIQMVQPQQKCECDK